MFTISSWAEQNLEAARQYFEDTVERLKAVSSHSKNRSVTIRATNAFYVAQAAVMIIEREPDQKNESLAQYLIKVLNDGLRGFSITCILEKEYKEYQELKAKQEESDVSET